MPAPSAAAAESGSGSGARSRSAEPMAELGEPGRHVAELLKAIPDELLARAAFACGAHARALLYFETHVRAKERGTLNPVAARSATYSDGDVSFFQVGLSSIGIVLEAAENYRPAVTGSCKHVPCALHGGLRGPAMLADVPKGHVCSR